VLADAAYGDDCNLRAEISGIGLTYVLGIRSATTVWAPGTAPLPPKPWSARGLRSTRLRRDAAHQPVAVKDLALGLPARAWRKVCWREGSRAGLAARFAALQGRPAHCDTLRSEPWPEEWLLIEWPKGDQDTCVTQRLPAAWRRRSGLSAMSRIPSRLSGAASPSLSSIACRDARAASPGRTAAVAINDTVVLGVIRWCAIAHRPACLPCCPR
jgi:DDE superfamily endonuclease